MQHVSDLHPKFALRPHHVWKYGRYPAATADIRRGKKIERKKKRKKKPQDENIMSVSVTQGGHNQVAGSRDKHYESCIYRSYRETSSGENKPSPCSTTDVLL